LQILGCELHKNAFLAARLHPNPLRIYSALPHILAITRGGEGGKGKERVGNSRERRKGREDSDMLQKTQFCFYLYLRGGQQELSSTETIIRFGPMHRPQFCYRSNIKICITFHCQQQLPVA